MAPKKEIKKKIKPLEELREGEPRIGTRGSAPTLEERNRKYIIYIYIYIYIYKIVNQKCIYILIVNQN